MQQLKEYLANTLEYLDTGGWVMMPLLVVSIVMFLLIVKKYLDMKAFTQGDKAVEDVISHIHEPEFVAAPWQEQILDGFLRTRSFNHDLDVRTIESLRLRQEAVLDRYTKMIMVLAGVAPLLGLLGTVSGMINTFTVISRVGTGNAKALASGISEALITTQTGLVIAVPGLFLVNYLSRRAQRTKERMNRFCLGLLRSHRLINVQSKKDSAL